MNDERPIEKLLRRYAKKRRDEAGDPLSLHPATRRLLQGEVARQCSKPSRDGKSSAAGFLALLAQRWAFVLGVLVVLAVTAAVVLPTFKSKRESEFLAQKQTSEDLAVRESLAPTSTPASAAPPAESQASTITLAEGARNQPAHEPAISGNFNRVRSESLTVTNSTAAGSISRFADAKSDADSYRDTEASRQVSPSAAPATRSLSVPARSRAAGETKLSDSLTTVGNPSSGRDDSGFAADRFNEARQPATPPPPAAAATTASARVQDKSFVARGGGVEKDAERVYSQSFANVAPEELRAKAAKVKSETPVVPVLYKFQVQQMGDQLRVIDGDGSTYLGEINKNFAVANRPGTGGKETATLAFETAKKPAQGFVGGITTSQQATQDYLWRVEGTNRTLNQNVVFTWNFVVTTNNPTTTQLNALRGALNQNAATPSQFPTLLNNSIINGRAQLGAQQIEVNAVPMK